MATENTYDRLPTENGYDKCWIKAINTVLEERESEVRITDITDAFWHQYIGPMIDEIESVEAQVVYRPKPRKAKQAAKR
jgi:hypothetical protein